MRIFLFLFFPLLLNVSSRVFGQGKVKPVFNSLEFASYERNGLNAPNVTFYIIINKAGRINIVDKREKLTGYYSYVLPDSTISVLNTIFNDTKPLESYIVTNKLQSGFHYAGEYSFVEFHGKNKNNNYLTYIDPFMSDGFNDAYRAVIMTFSFG